MTAAAVFVFKRRRRATTHLCVPPRREKDWYYRRSGRPRHRQAPQRRPVYCETGDSACGHPSGAARMSPLRRTGRHRPPMVWECTDDGSASEARAHGRTDGSVVRTDSADWQISWRRDLAMTRADASYRAR
uniref:Uncharacterized protein n=1 Tax=Plectus sambesii TaxID=2011161 RepID=A0A914V3E6_9BILA